MAQTTLIRVIDLIEKLDTFPYEYKFVGSMNTVVLSIQIYDSNIILRNDTLYLAASDSFSETALVSLQINIILVEADAVYVALHHLQELFNTIFCLKNNLPIKDSSLTMPTLPDSDLVSARYSQETFLLDLLQKKHHYENMVDSIYESLYHQPKELFFLMAVSTIFSSNICNLKDTISHYTGYTCCEYQHYIVCLIPMQYGTSLNSKTYDGFLSYLIQNNLHAGISNGFHSLLKADVAFEQADTVFRIGFHMKKSLHFYLYEDYLISAMFQTCRKDCDLFDLVHPDVMQVYHYDLEHHTEYLLTLAAYILLEKSVQATSKALYIHRNTMFHRLEKLKTYFNIDFKDSRMRTKLHISILIFAYLGIIDASDFQPK